jgi:hypothetical protein
VKKHHWQHWKQSLLVVLLKVAVVECLILLLNLKVLQQQLRMLNYLLELLKVLLFVD